MVDPTIRPSLYELCLIQFKLDIVVGVNEFKAHSDLDQEFKNQLMKINI